MGEEGESQFRTEMDSSSKRKLEEIQIAKQKAQEIVARLVNDAEAKRPRFDEPSETHGPDTLLPLAPDFPQRPPSQPMANSQVGSFPFAAQPVHYNNFQGTSKKVDVPNAKVGVIIGKGGETIKYLQLQSGARIQVTRDADADPYSQTREVELTGTLEQVSRAEQLIKDVISESDAGGSSTSGARGITSLQPGTEQFSMRVPNNKVAMIIGKGGETIKNMQNKSGARIQVVPLHPPPGDTSTERTVFINGSKDSDPAFREKNLFFKERGGEIPKMQRVCRRLLSREDFFHCCRSNRRFFSSLAEREDASSLHDNAVLPKMPPFDYSPPPYTGPSAAEILQKRREFLSPSMFCFYKKPLNVVDGKKQYLFDEDGRRYLDAFGGIATVCCGHCHPDVVEAIINQTKRLQHSTVVYLNNAIADFAEALASKLPGDLKVVFFTNSGTEANELAMMIARLYTGYHDIISLRNAYHGNAAGTMGATAQSNWKFNVVQSGVHHAMNPDQYRGVFGSDGEKYAKDVQEMIDYGTCGRVAAFISEAIQGVGGILELAPGYLPAVYSSIKKAGGLCIADEVQSGFARTGSHFWGFEAHGVVPDIVTMAKGIGNGLPIGAVVTTPEIAQVLTQRSYFNTFGGNPVCTAGGHAVLKVLEKEKLQENALVVGSYLKDRLKSLQEKHEIIGDVRGRGLMLGVELVTDRQLKTPSKTEILHVMDQMKDVGVLVGKGGFFGNVFRITPPLCFTKEDADFLVDAMDYSMSKI